MKLPRKFILAFDPSGAFNEGKGHTGICLLNAELKIPLIVYQLCAKDYNNAYKYWDAVLKEIESYNKKYNNNLVVVIEDYILYESKAHSQINSHMETSQLIGIMKHYCAEHSIPCFMQAASLVKNRWSDDILVWKNIVQKQGNKYLFQDSITNNHMRDAIRHAIHFAYFKNKETKK